MTARYDRSSARFRSAFVLMTFAWIECATSRAMAELGPCTTAAPTTPEVVMFVSDLNRSMRWYREKVGLEASSLNTVYRRGAIGREDPDRRGRARRRSSLGRRRALYDRRETLHLREVSSRTFWGLSKVLDNRSDLIASLLGLAECPYPAQPVHLNIYFVGVFSWILFVENKTAFERAIRDAREALLHGRFSAYAGAALIYSSGFMGTAGRMRKSSGSRAFHCLDASRPSTPPSIATSTSTQPSGATLIMRAWPSFLVCGPTSLPREPGSQVMRLC